MTINTKNNTPVLLERLATILDDEQIKTDTASLEHFGNDWSKQFTPAPVAIVFPKSTEQVQAIVQLCNELEIVIVPSGGRTGLSAGAVATHGELVLSLDKMNHVLQFYPADRMVKVQAGMATKALQDFAANHHLFYPVDFASSGSSQIGGNIATNAGGIKVIRYGMTRQWVAGLTVVTGRGDILELNHGMIKNATGYDLRQLFIGSEGTLGVITEAQMRLTLPPQALTVMVFAVESFAAVMPILQAYQSQIPLTAFEFFDQVALEKVLASGAKAPFETRSRFYVLLEFENLDNATETALTLFEHCSEQGWILDGVMSESLSQAQDLWRLRESISETLSAFSPYKNDLSVLIEHVPQFIADIDAVIGENYDFVVSWYGHIGDGNVHLNILKPIDWDKEQFFAKCRGVNDKIFAVVQRYNGSISAEHGVGLVKKPYLHYSRPDAELAYLRAIKAAFDPKNIMNRGKLLE